MFDYFHESFIKKYENNWKCVTFFQTEFKKQSFLNVLKALAPSIEDLKIEEIDIEQPLTPNTETMIFPKLKKLEVFNYRENRENVQSHIRHILGGSSKLEIFNFDVVK